MDQVDLIGVKLHCQHCAPSAFVKAARATKDGVEGHIFMRRVRIDTGNEGVNEAAEENILASLTTLKGEVSSIKTVFFMLGDRLSGDLAN